MTAQHRVFFAGSRQVTPLCDRLAAAAAAGFTAVTAWPGDVLGEDRASLKAAIAEHGLVLTDFECIGSWLPGHDTAQGGWADMVRDATPDRIIPLAAQMGARTVSVVELLGAVWEPAAFARAFADICDRAADHGLTVAIEPMPIGAITDLARARELIDRAGRSNAGIMLDTWHFFRSHSPLEALAACPGELILSVQLNDAPAHREPDLDTAMMRRLLPGEGGLDLAGFMQALAATRTTAPIGVETFSPDLDALDMASAAAACAKALDHCLRLVP